MVLIYMLYPQNNAIKVNTIVPIFQIRYCGLEMLTDLINKIK